MKRIVIACVLAVAGCHTSQTAEPIIADPSQPPPLPPASGTAIGLLLDDTRLTLRPDQADRLRAIDRQLETRNAALDEHVPHAAPSGGGPGPQARGGHHRRAAPANDGQQMPNGAPGQISDAEAANTRDAVAKALAVLDPDQRTTAETIFHEHGVTTTPAEATSTEAAPAPAGDGEPASADEQ